MATPFGSFFYEVLRRQGLSANRFAKRVHTSSGCLSSIYSGVRRPPLDRIQTWADALGLHGPDREAFVTLANLEHTPPLIRDLVRDLRAERDRLVDELEQRMTRASAGSATGAARDAGSAGARADETS